MKSLFFFRIFILSILVIYGLQNIPQAYSAIIDEIPAADLGRLNAGETLEYSVAVGKSGYPATVLYRTGSFAPEEVAAVSFDYELQPTYFSKLTYAKIANWNNNAEAVVDYTIKLSAFLPAVSFQTVNRVTKVGYRSFQNNSNLANPGAIRNCQILFGVESYQNGSLIKVYSWIEPALPISSGMIRSGAIEMFTGLIRQVELERIEQKILLTSQLARLKEAVGSFDRKRVFPGFDWLLGSAYH